jgi:rubrerythrin
MSIQTHLTEKFVRALISTPRGRAHLLAQIADAEDNGEAKVFDEALSIVEDPQLQRLISRHRDDELRHGRLFREALHRTGVDPGPVPEQLQALANLDEELGGFFQRPVTDRRGVVTAYTALLALEERAMDQFGMYRRLFAEVDPATSAVFEEVAADEERHLKYCHAITKRYAESEEARLAELERMRVLEAKAFQKTQRANMAYIEANDLFPDRSTRIFWRVIGRLTRLVEPLPMTRYAYGAV